jgi:hypothetical protein
MKHRARVYFPIAFFTCLMVVISPLFASSASTQASSDRGAAIFENLVPSAMASAQVKPKLAPSLYGVLREGSEHSEETVRQVIANGEGTMPGFKEKLEPREIDDLLEYLRT